MTRTILAVIGSRQAAIRIAPLVCLLRRVPSMQAVVCITSPHAQMIARELAVFGLQADEVVDRVTCQSDCDIASAVQGFIGKHKPDFVLVSGDAGVVMGAYRHHPAYSNLGCGLRLYELHHAGSEAECVELVATHYFVASEAARDSLRRVGVGVGSIYVTDSTVVDALLMVIDRIRSDDSLQAGLAAAFPAIEAGKRMVYVAGYRRHSEPERLESLWRAIKRLAMRPDVHVICQTHPEPRLRSLADDIFADHPAITTIEPPDYLHHVYLMQAAYLILTDCDDTCEDVLSLGKPVLMVREGDEGGAGDDSGTVRMVGTDTEGILRECNMFLDDEDYYLAFTSSRNSHGDGQASQRIVETMLR